MSAALLLLLVFLALAAPFAACHSAATTATVYYDSKKDSYSLTKGVIDHQGAAYGMYIEVRDEFGPLRATICDTDRARHER